MLWQRQTRLHLKSLNCCGKTIWLRMLSAGNEMRLSWCGFIAPPWLYWCYEVPESIISLSEWEFSSSGTNISPIEHFFLESYPMETGDDGTKLHVILIVHMLWLCSWCNKNMWFSWWLWQLWQVLSILQISLDDEEYYALRCSCKSGKFHSVNLVLFSLFSAGFLMFG